MKINEFKCYLSDIDKAETIKSVGLEPMVLNKIN